MDRGATTVSLFIALGVVRRSEACCADISCFTEQITGRIWRTERRRAGPALMIVDVLIAAVARR